MIETTLLTRSGQTSTTNLGKYNDITDLDTKNFSILDNEGRKIPFHVINEDVTNITLSVKYPNAEDFQDRVFFAENESPLIVEEIEANVALVDYKLAWGY